MSSSPTRADSRSGRLRISPRARRLVAERGIDPATIRGSGPNGRITAADVVATPAGASALRLATARAVTLSFASTPHFYLRVEIDAGRLVSLLRQLQGTPAGPALTLTPFLVRALGLALARCPSANRVWRDDSTIELPGRHVGLVVGLDDGLRVPIIRDANRLSLEATARRVAELAAAARAGSAGLDATLPCAISLSNLGKRRVDEFTALIPPGQSSVLAVGCLARRPFVRRGRLRAAWTLRLTLSVDHRVLDGRPAADFLEQIAALLEHPARLLYGSGDSDSPS